MSLQVLIKMVCDSCGETLSSDVGVKSTQLYAYYGDFKHKADDAGWVIMKRGGLPKHFCSACSEKVPAR